MAKGNRETMSDEEKEIDIESDDEGAENGEETQFMSQADKRAHHNALERKRRDHIKDSFAHLRDSIPSLQGEKASRAQILNKATDYIQFMRRKNHSHQANRKQVDNSGRKFARANVTTDIDDLKRQNGILDQQVRALEKARNSGHLSIDVTTALLTTTDNLLSTSPTGDGLLEGTLKQDPSSPLNNNAEITSDDEYSNRAKRRKRDV